MSTLVPMLVIAELPYWVVNLSLLAVILGSAMLMLMVLIQKPQGGGLAGAFGSGAGSGQTAFGTKTGDALTIATIIVFVAWLLLAVGTNFAARPAKVAATPADEQQQTTAPATDAPPTTGTTPETAPVPAPATNPAPATDAAPTGAAPAATTPPATAPVNPAPAATPTPAPAPAPTPSTEPIKPN